jgi:hypothetical protein
MIGDVFQPGVDGVLGESWLELGISRATVRESFCRRAAYSAGVWCTPSPSAWTGSESVSADATPAEAAKNGGSEECSAVHKIMRPRIS